MTAEAFYVGTIIGGTTGLLGLAFLVVYAVFGLRPQLKQMRTDIGFIKTINAMYRDSVTAQPETSPGSSAVSADEKTAETESETDVLRRRVRKLSADNERLSYGMASLFGAHPAPATYNDVAKSAHDTAVQEVQRAVAAVIEPSKQ